MRILVTILVCTVVGLVVGFLLTEPGQPPPAAGQFDFAQIGGALTGAAVGFVVGFPLGIYVDARGALKKRAPGANGLDEEE